MLRSNRRIRRTFLLSATAAAAATVIVAGVTSSVAAQPASGPGTTTSLQGPGYPAPGGIYAPFTNCPLKNPVIHESVSFAACVRAAANTGSITIGNITTPVVRPVDVQFGFFQPPGLSPDQFASVLPPLTGLSAQLVAAPELLPVNLTTALGCPSSDPTVEGLCQTAQQKGGTFQQIFAVAESAGAITNFALLSWTQPVKFQLVNPLLGNNCFIGSDGNPVVTNPQLNISSLDIVNDPNPTAHPDTSVLVAQASASDSTFAAPGVTGCGPGGVANIAVDNAIDTSAGLPAASGNSLTLTGTFSIAVTSASMDPAVPQPADDAAILLSAFKASAGHSPHGVHRHRMTVADLKKMFHIHS
jgi:hypothetical protein